MRGGPEFVCIGQGGPEFFFALAEGGGQIFFAYAKGGDMKLKSCQRFFLGGGLKFDRHF